MQRIILTMIYSFVIANNNDKKVNKLINNNAIVICGINFNK